MKIRILLAALLTSCLTSCASYHGVLAPPAIKQIQPGVTTEANLVTLFGPPDTRLAAAYGTRTELTWFRSIPPPPSGYIPFVGQFLGGLDLDVRQLIVILGHGGRVTSYQFYDSNGGVQFEETRVRTRAGKDFRNNAA